MDFAIDEDARLEIEQSLDEYTKQIGLWANYKVEAPIYLNLPITELRKKTPEELSEAEYEINRYVMYLQRVINDHYKWDRWATSMLDSLASFYLPEVGPGHGYGEKILVAKNTPALCIQLNQFIRENRLKLDSLKDIPKRIEAMAANIRDIRFSQLKREKTED